MIMMIMIMIKMMMMMSYLNLVFGIWLQSGHIIGGHIGIASIEPQRLTVVLVESLLQHSRDRNRDGGRKVTITDRVPGLDVDLVSSDHAVLLVVRGGFPVDHHGAGVERFGRHVSRLARHCSSMRLVSEISQLQSIPPTTLCQIQIVFNIKSASAGNI